LAFRWPTARTLRAALSAQRQQSWPVFPAGSAVLTFSQAKTNYKHFI
jgi:hypothetical protein